MTTGSIEPERGAPILHHEHDVLGQRQLLEPGVEIGNMVEETIRAPRRFAGLAEADQIWREHASERHCIWDNVPPHVGRGRIAVKEHDRITLPDMDVGHLGIEHGQSFHSVWECAAYRPMLHCTALA
jgi:hypothetical protein